MLHMILGILKVIGLIAGILLLLLLAVLLALVFVPVRYKLTAKLLPEQYEFSLRGSWLLHIASASVSADPVNGRRIALRLFGIRLPLFRNGDRTEDDPDGRAREDDGLEYDGREEEEEKRDKKEKKKREKKAEKEKKRGEGTDQREETRTGTESDIEKKPGEEQGVKGSETPEDTVRSAEEPETAERNILQKIWFQCRRICGKIRQIIQKLIQAVRDFRQKLVRLKKRTVQFGHKVLALLRKPGELREFIEEYELREVFGGLIGHLLFLIGHYKPRRIRGYLRFGTDDPSVTGQLTGLIYILLPARAERYSVEPEFNETVFETETICSGHIRALHVLRVLWRAFRDKKLRKVINKLRKRGDS